MKKLTFLLFAWLLLTQCVSKKKDDFGSYYNLKEQDEILTSIVAHLFTPPPYVSKEDRLKKEHRLYYNGLTGRFKMIKYHVDEKGTHYFYLIRPASIASEKRAVGGSFTLGPDYELKHFREAFVTTVMTEEDLKTKAAFLFDEMVKGNLDRYLGMKDYIQWPNDISQYDTTAYEWKLKPGALDKN